MQPSNDIEIWSLGEWIGLHLFIAWLQACGQRVRGQQERTRVN